MLSVATRSATNLCSLAAVQLLVSRRPFSGTKGPFSASSWSYFMAEDSDKADIPAAEPAGEDAAPAPEVAPPPITTTNNGQGPMSEVKEGQARIQQPGNEVFYNVAQVTNRDLSVAVLQQFVKVREAEVAEGKLKRLRRRQKGAPVPAPAAEAQGDGQSGVRVLEALSASGLRSIRYALEVEGLSGVDANDMDPNAVQSIDHNVKLNGEKAMKLIRSHCSDARMLMMQRPLTYDVVDLDPYGSPSQLLDGAMQALAEGGLLMVTATDMAVLCGNNGEVCWTKYGSYPVHRPYCHEMAVRILLACLNSRASVYKRYIVPLVSLSLDFYVRVFVRVYTSPAISKDCAHRLAYLYQSSGCDSFYLQRVGHKGTKGSQIKYTPSHGPVVPQKCPFTGSGYLMGGPIWAEPMHDTEFVKAVLTDMEARKQGFAQFTRIKGVLTAVLEELPDVPLYFSLHEICKTLRSTPPKASVIRSAIINAGYRVSSTHANPLGIKTDAPWNIIWDILRCWVKKHPVKPQDPKSYAYVLLSKEPEHVADFSLAGGAISKAKTEGVSRFVQNPPNWGPKSRHGRTAADKAAAAALDKADQPKPSDAPDEGTGTADDGDEQMVDVDLNNESVATTSNGIEHEGEAVEPTRPREANHDPAGGGSGMMPEVGKDDEGSRPGLSTENDEPGGGAGAGDGGGVEAGPLDTSDAVEPIPKRPRMHQ